MYQTKRVGHPLRLLLFFCIMTALWMFSLYRVYGASSVAGIEEPNWQASSGALPTLDKMQLNVAGDVHDIHIAATGEIIVSDYGAGEIWKVSADQKQYTRYHNLGAVENAAMDKTGKLWWVDGTDRIGTIAPNAAISTTWIITSEEQVLLSSFTFDDDDQPWFAEGFGATSRLYQFNTTSNQLCSHVISGGVASNGLVYQNKQFWFIDWGKDRLIRFSPEEKLITYWFLNFNSFVEGLTIDKSGNLWWVDSNDESLNRFQPASSQWQRFPLQVGKNPLRVAAGNSRIWYTEPTSGTIGSLAITATTSITSLTSLTATVPFHCSTPLIEGTGVVSTSSGAIEWKSTTATVDPFAAWDVYRLPESRKPWGIAVGQNFVWISDSKQQQLLRLHVKDDSDTPLSQTTNVFLPLVSRN